MRIRFLPLQEITTSGVAFGGTSIALPQAALGQKPSDAYRYQRTEQTPVKNNKSKPRKKKVYRRSRKKHRKAKKR
jgi:hypothetical protein